MYALFLNVRIIFIGHLSFNACGAREVIIIIIIDGCCGCVVGDDLRRTLHVLLLVAAYPGCPWIWPLNELCCCCY